MSEETGVRLPAGGTELLVDQLAGRGLVKGNVLAGGPGAGDEVGEGLGRSGLCLGLQALQLGGEGELGLLGLLGQSESRSVVFRLPAGLLFRRGTALLGLAGRSQSCRRGVPLRRQLAAHLRELAEKILDLALPDSFGHGRIGWRQKWPRAEPGIREGALKPDPELPSEPQMKQRLAMAPGGLMSRLIAGPPQAMEQLCGLGRHDAAVLQAT
ncbi:MAG TPA: hypothetical protein VH988_27360 [Thermoanaerobaculia bacterium]|jgi:hypothetical protein|nr:hypothetical protein [Thermoanaerobaculia bacterium]